MNRRWPAMLPALLAACASQAPHSPPSVGKGAEQKPAYVLKRSGAFYQDDGPGEHAPPAAVLEAIANAEPKIEPLHRFANKPYSVLGQDYVPLTRLTHYKALGIGSWYGKKFHGQKTSSGEIYDMYGMSAAHATLPIPSYVRVTNPANGRSVVVRVNDRGPFHSGRLIDLSYAAAWKLGYVEHGSTLLDIESVLPGETTVAANSGASADPIARLAELAAAAPQRVAPLPEVNDSRGVFLQLGAFGNSDNAESLKSRLGRDLASIQDSGDLTGKLQVQARGGIFRVQLGPWRDHLEAQQIAERLRAAFDLKSVVVR